MGFAQELLAQGPGTGSAARRPRQPDGQFPRRAPQKRDSSIDHRPRGEGSQACYSANALMENRHGLLIEFGVAPADGYAERNSARTMLETALPGSRRITLGADKGYDTRELVASCRALKLTPHIARNEDRAGGSAIDCRTARHAGYAVSPKGAQAGRRDLRLDENRRRPAAYPLPRLRPHPVACLPGGCRLQPAPHRQAQPGSRVNQNHKRLSRLRSILMARRRHSLTRLRRPRQRKGTQHET